MKQFLLISGKWKKEQYLIVDVSFEQRLFLWPCGKLDSLGSKSWERFEKEDGKAILQESSGHFSVESFWNSCRNSSKDPTTNFLGNTFEDYSTKSAYMNFQEIYRSSSVVFNRIPPWIHPWISSGDFLQAFVREFASGIPSALCSRNPFRMFFRNFLRGIHPEIPPGISSRSF